MKSVIVIPARYPAKRLPGKPLVRIGGVPLLARVARLAQTAAALTNSELVVATDHAEVLAYAAELNVKAVMTDPDLPSGSDRALAAISALGLSPDVVVNLQGDAPFTPPEYIATLLQTAAGSNYDLYTPGVQLDWDELDQLREHKKVAPSSGTTCVRNADGRALWFSKNILPQMRDEAKLRSSESLSPVIRHIGLYAYRFSALARYVTLPPSLYEVLEGLEQLRALEVGMAVHLSVVPPPRISMSGIDTPEDVKKAESKIAASGDPFETGVYI